MGQNAIQKDGGIEQISQKYVHFVMSTYSPWGYRNLPCSTLANLYHLDKSDHVLHNGQGTYLGNQCLDPSLACNGLPRVVCHPPMVQDNAFPQDHNEQDRMLHDIKR